MIVLSYTTGQVTHLAFASTGALLAVSHNHHWLVVWDLVTQQVAGGRMWSRRKHAEFRFHPTEPRIYQLQFEDEVEWLDPMGKDWAVFAEKTGWAENVLLTHDAKNLLVHDRVHSEFRHIDLTKGKRGKLLWSVPVYSENASGVRLNMEFLPGEERFIVAENHGNTRTRISVRSLATGELLASTRFPQRETLGMALSPDGTVLVVISEMSLFVYDTEHLKTAPLKIKNDNRKHFKGIAYHPSGKYLAVASNDESVKLFDTTTWTVAKTYMWKIGRMLRVAFSPDGTLAAAGSDTGKVVLWDVDV